MRQPRFTVLWFLFFTYALTVVGQGVHLYVMHRLTDVTPAGTPIAHSPVSAWMPYGFYITNLGPSLVGLLMTLSLYGFAGIRQLAIQLLPWSVGRAWPVLVACLFLPLLMVVMPATFHRIFYGFDRQQSWSLAEFVYGAVVSGGLIGSGICEEIGWRGFALPQLQRTHSALVSSLILGVAWALWHWPNYFVVSNQHPWWQMAALIPMGMVASILYTWVYNSTGGSLFAVVVLHGATVSTPVMSVSVGPSVAVIAATLYVLLAIGLVWRYGAVNLSWRDRVVAQPCGDADVP